MRMPVEQQAEALRVHREIVDPVAAAATYRFGEKYPAWGDSFRDGTYDDASNLARLRRAEDDLASALRSFRDGSGTDQELLKRAADVLNQVAMLVDPVRIAKSARTNAD